MYEEDIHNIYAYIFCITKIWKKIVSQKKIKHWNESVKQNNSAHTVETNYKMENVM